MIQTDSLSLFDEEINRREVPALKTNAMVVGDDGEKLFAAGVADMDFKAPPPVLEAMQKRLDHGIFGYETVPAGLMPALIDWLKNRHDWQVPKEHILTSPNILTALAMAASLFTEEGDAVIVQPPVFFDFFDVLQENHRQIIQNPLIYDRGQYQMDFEDLENKASDAKTKMIYHCITCISPAKTFNIASCCASFTVIADDDKRKAFQIENSRLSVNKNNPFANVAMEAAYTNGAPWLKAVISYLEGNVEIVRNTLGNIAGVELVEPDGTFLLWVDFNGLGLGLDELDTFLREEAQWSVTRGHSFGKEGNGFARVNIACTRAKLEAALSNIELACSKLKP